jgi:hypothetical protein
VRLKNNGFAEASFDLNASVCPPPVGTSIEAPPMPGF